MANNIRKCWQRLNLDNTQGSKDGAWEGSPAGRPSCTRIAAATVGVSVELNLSYDPSPTQSVTRSDPACHRELQSGKARLCSACCGENGKPPARREQQDN